MPPAPRRGPVRGRARYRRILRFALGAMLPEWWNLVVLPRIGLGRLGRRGMDARMLRVARRFRPLAVDLGGLMIKVGQFMSSRLDVLPPEITAELEGLQDEVPAAPVAGIRALAEAELGLPLERAFAWFDPEPLAAASLGQAHRARLSDELAADAGFADVVVKVQRPGIDEIVEVDLAALRRVAGWLSRVGFVARRVDVPALVEEFAATSREEIDYVHEAENAVRFADAFAGDARVAAPEVAWERSTRRVLTLSDVTAIKISDRAALAAAGIDPARVAEAFAAVMFDQLFRDGFFHADPHPGNIFVTPTADPGGFRLTFVDFGMMGRVPDRLRGALRALVISVAARDGAGMVAAMEQTGALLPSADSGQLARALGELFARFGGMGIAELRDVDPREFAGFADRFGELMRTLPFQLPENFLLLVRAVSVTSGVCTGLDPAFNMWAAVEPYAGKLVREEAGGTIRGLADRVLGTATSLAALPGRLDAVVAQLESGRFPVATPDAVRASRRVERAIQRLTAAVVFVGMLVGGLVLRESAPFWGAALAIASVIPFLGAILPPRRHRGSHEPRTRR